MIDKADLEVLEKLMRMYGLFAVLVMIKQMATDTCKEYTKLGNHEAIIHHDTMSLANCIEAMKLNFPLPEYREAAVEMMIEEMKS